MRLKRFTGLFLLAAALCACEDDESTSTDTEEVTGAADLVGYRASLYDTDFPTERKNLNGTHTLMNVGFPRDVRAEDVLVETIEMPFPALLYSRDPDEIFVFGGTPLALDTFVSLIDGLPEGESETAPYFAKYTPSSGELVSIDLDRGSGLPYLGGALVHADGFVYVASQAHLYKFEPTTMTIEASIDLPAPDPGTVYNGLAVSRTGELILKSTSFLSGDTGLLLINTDPLETVFSTPCECASARLTLAIDDQGVEHLYHLNREITFRYVVEPGSLTLDTDWVARFDPDGRGENQEPTSPVVLNGRVYYTTNTNFESTLPMRVFWQEQNATYTPEMPPLTGPLLFDDPEERAGWSFSGMYADESTGVLLALDQGRGLVNAFLPRDDGSIDILWQKQLTVSAGNTLVADRRMVYFTDFVNDSNNLVVLDLDTGDELLRLPTPAKRATIGSILLTRDGEAYLASNEPGEPTGLLLRFRVR
ncbi:MAG: hypothetical protein AAFU77_00265 [Myxococcota bacterium]